MDKNSAPDLSLDCKNTKITPVRNKIQGKTVSKKRKATLRKDGRFQVYALVNGTRKAVYGMTEAEANRKADEAEAEAVENMKAVSRCDVDQEETVISFKEKEKYTFENCFYRYRNYQLWYGAVEPQTVDRYEVTYRKYFPARKINTKDVRFIVSKDIQYFLLSVLNEYERITQKEYQRIRHIIQAVINYVYDEELDESVDYLEPVIDWDKIKRKIPRGKIYKAARQQHSISKENKQKLKDKVLVEHVYPEDYTYVLLLLINFSLGLRLGELAALTVDDIDMKQRIVSVTKSCKKYRKRDEYGNPVGKNVYSVDTTKTPKGIRNIPISDTAYHLFKILFEYRKNKGITSKYLAYDETDLKARQMKMDKVLRKLCSRADIEEFSSHIIRKTFATSLSKSPDIDIATIADYLGHAQVSTTFNNYIISENDTTEERIRKMSEYV